MLRLTVCLTAGLLLFCGCSASKSAHHAAGPGPVLTISAAEVQALAARPGAQATLVNVWATWCPPCRREFPALVQVGEKRRADGLRLVFVSADPEEQVADVRKFLASHGVSDTAYIMTGDPNAFINTLNPKWTGAIPATFVYNRRGELASFWEGAVDEDHFNQSVDQAIAIR
jgi:thiol-disulfide isomerase/thioredoxin